MLLTAKIGATTPAALLRAMKSRSHLAMKATFNERDGASGGLAAAAAIAVIAVHFKPNIRIRIGLEPTPARVCSRR